MGRGVIDTAKMPTHVFPPGESGEAMRMFKAREDGVVIMPRGG